MVDSIIERKGAKPARATGGMKSGAPVALSKVTVSASEASKSAVKRAASAVSTAPSGA